MKKLTAILLTLLTAVSLAACAGNSEPAETNSPDAESGTSEEISSQAGSPDGFDAESETAQTEEDETEETSSVTDNDDGTGEIKVLVAYFSATNTTKGVAEYVADVVGADLYEIVPEELYTDADLNYNDNSSRSTIEMDDPSARPAISGSVENMEQYDIVFIGYPIWWGDAPRIVSTFVESYDFSGKTIVPFCTSDGSGIGSSAANLEQLTSGAEWLAGQRLNGGSSRDEIAEWVNRLELDVSAQ